MPASPPGPTAPAFAQTVLYHRDPLGVLLRARARYGPVFTLRMPLKGPMVCIAAPDAVARLLQADDATARAGAARRRILPLASPRSPFGADGAEHRAIRGVMEPAFTRATVDSIRAVAAEHVATWPTGAPFRLLPRMRTIATDVFVRLVLGVEDPARRSALVAAIRRLLSTPGNPPLPIPGDGDGALGAAADRVFRQRMAPVARLLEEEIGTRRAAGSSGEDLLGRVVDSVSGPREAVDRLMVVIAAAQEPPAIALTNMVYELARRPSWQDRFLHDPGCRDGVVAEVLRLRPSAQAVLRELTAPDEVAGHELVRGTLVALPSPLLHRDPGVFPDPHAFRPERFGVDPFATPGYFPFGGGARRYVGEPLARAELRTVVPLVLERLHVRVAWPRPERMVVRGTVLVPHRSALVRTTRRS
jgi:cytochrome P450